MTRQQKTSWESSAKWYDEAVGEKGHYYHEHVIFPNLLRLMGLAKTSDPKVLDVACGQGILARQLPKGVIYTGIDISPSLIQSAKEKADKKHHRFLVQDATLQMVLPERDFTHATVILALQNIEGVLQVLKNIHRHLIPGGKLFIVLNHPCFRIPRQSSWGIDEAKKLQYRRVDCYLSPLEIPIQTHPGKNDAVQTLSFHHPLMSYTKWLKEAGFVILEIEEWISDKKSTGAKARMENRSREEFPLFLTLVCKHSDLV
ncbi:MAG: class I SAM-dependent methyltransferase [Verrucomicrobia bacterium]|nr:class I SAM-dependent methyltransferase [Verrucomicrobiota bacterium]